MASSANVEGIRWEVLSQSETETEEWGRRLGQLLGPGDVVLLKGDLGAGKTTFARGLATGLGLKEAVTSPTFTLIHEHPGEVPLFHVDLYRLGGEAEAAGLGLEDYLYGEGVTAIEWPERAGLLIPTTHLIVRLTPAGESTRRIGFAPAGERYDSLVAALRASADKQGAD